MRYSRRNWVSIQGQVSLFWQQHFSKKYDYGFLDPWRIIISLFFNEKQGQL
jgi:hypothetical protein